MERVRGRWVGRTVGTAPALDASLVKLGLDEPVEVESGMLAREEVLLRTVGTPGRSKLPDVTSSSPLGLLSAREGVNTPGLRVVVGVARNAARAVGGVRLCSLIVAMCGASGVYRAARGVYARSSDDGVCVCEEEAPRVRDCGDRVASEGMESVPGTGMRAGGSA